VSILGNPEQIAEGIGAGKPGDTPLPGSHNPLLFKDSLKELAMSLTGTKPANGTARRHHERRELSGQEHSKSGRQ
jgi:hypothetical protein